ncbi:MAG: thiamine-phosphate kinase [Actinomycetota bacterium]
MDRNENELLEAIGKVLSGAGPEVIVGVGDDAAVLSPATGEQLLTTDALVEGTHFELGLTSARDLGYKAIAVNVSDIAAMGGSPRAALCALTLSDAVDAAWVIELIGGMRECCDEYALWLVGGNLARGDAVSVVVTVTGEVAPGRAVTRGGARVGDRVVVTGELGSAAVGLRVARSSGAPDREALAALHAYLRPTPRVGEASVLARHGATAMLDVSDGLAIDLSRLCEASGVGARIGYRQLPLAPGAQRTDVLGGGEDYELLATLPSGIDVDSARTALREGFGVPLAEIGAIIEKGLVLEEIDGSEHALAEQGWDHFG